MTYHLKDRPHDIHIFISPNMFEKERKGEALT